MKQTRIIMGMPITVEVIDETAGPALMDEVFAFFEQVDQQFSPYKKNSELARLNRGLPTNRWSPRMKEVLALAEKTRLQTKGFFNIRQGGGRLDTSGLVKGWAIQGAAQLLVRRGCQNFYVEAGGDIQVRGRNAYGQAWRIGLRNPFNRQEIVKVIDVDGEGVATSGSYIRGNHVYDPHQPKNRLKDIVSITVIGPCIFDADRMATAAFAMGRSGAAFIESLKGFEAYMIDRRGLATMTSGFERYVV